MWRRYGGHPTACTQICAKIWFWILPDIFDGDQLTRERVVGAQDAKLQSDEELRRLRGVIAQSGDWHAQVCFHQV